MPKPLIDWALAQSLFLQGLTATAIARQFGVSVASVSKQSTRNGWVKLRDQTEAKLGKPVENMMVIRVAAASNTVRAKLAERLVALSERLPSTPQSLNREIKLQSQLESAVRNAERIFGWSSENGSSLVRTSLLSTAVIDITPKKEDQLVQVQVQSNPVLSSASSDAGLDTYVPTLPSAPSDGSLGNQQEKSILSADTSMEQSTGETL